MAEKYISYTLCCQIGDWKAELFYIDNHALALPERTSGPPQKHNEWYARAENGDQVAELLQRITERRKEGVTGATIVASWLRRQVQPLQCHSSLGFEYTGLYDPSRFSSEKTQLEEAMVLLHNLFEGVSSVPILPELFHVRNPPKPVRFRVIECFSKLSFCFLDLILDLFARRMIYWSFGMTLLCLRFSGQAT